MAEQEVAKHTKNLIGAVAGKHSLAHKAREILLEMAIIVFAVSMSIWFHSIGEHRHEQEQVRSFLLGLKTDLQSDLVQLDELVDFQRRADRHYAWLTALDPEGVPDPVPFEATYEFIDTNNILIPRQGRYEGFKSSGKLTAIENDHLLEQIIELYEYDIPTLKMSSLGWLSRRNGLGDFLRKATADDDSMQTRYFALTSRPGKLLLRKMRTISQLYDRAARVKATASAIVRAIDAAYPEQSKRH